LFNILVVLVSLWVVAYWPSLAISGRSGVIWMTVALVLCGLPGVVNQIIARSRVAPDPLVGVWLHMGVRVFFVFSGVVVVRLGWPRVGIPLFYGWLMGFYLVTMACEVWEYQRCLQSGPDTNR
jgi:hypothetical protein